MIGEIPKFEKKRQMQVMMVRDFVLPDLMKNNIGETCLLKNCFSLLTTHKSVGFANID